MTPGRAHDVARALVAKFGAVESDRRAAEAARIAIADAILSAVEAERLRWAVPSASTGGLEAEPGAAITVRDLKRLLATWPELNADCEPTEVWVETGRCSSSPVERVTPLSGSRTADGQPADMLLSPPPEAWDGAAEVPK